MGKILDMLYAGELHPADSVIQGCEEYDEMCRESLKEMERFTERLDEDMRLSLIHISEPTRPY